MKLLLSRKYIVISKGERVTVDGNIPKDLKDKIKLNDLKISVERKGDTIIVKPIDANEANEIRRYLRSNKKN